MYGFLTVLIIVTCLLIILIVLIQNPKGGGLGASFGGVSNNLMGVKKTTDFLEKATWGFAIALLTLSLMTNFFLPGDTVNNPQSLIKDRIQQPIPLQQQQVPTTPAPTQEPTIRLIDPTETEEEDKKEE